MNSTQNHQISLGLDQHLLLSWPHPIHEINLKLRANICRLLMLLKGMSLLYCLHPANPKITSGPETWKHSYTSFVCIKTFCAFNFKNTGSYLTIFADIQFFSWQWIRFFKIWPRFYFLCGIKFRYIAASVWTDMSYFIWLISVRERWGCQSKY